MRSSILGARKLALFAAAAAALAVTGPAAAATVLLDQPYQPANAGGFSNLSNFRWADPISFSDDVTVSQITWYGSSYGKNDAALSGLTFDLDFYADASGSPGASVAHLTGTPTLVDQGVLDRWASEVYRFTLDVTPVALSAHTTYFFSIAAPGTSDFIWEKTNDTCCSSLSGNGGGTWTQQVNEKQAFTLVGTVAGGAPEPAAWALMLTGFMGAGAMLRRRRAAAAV